MKKILALVLAAATAFSMFGASISASAAVDYLDGTAFLNDYKPTSVTVAEDKVTVKQPLADGTTNTIEINTISDLLNFAAHIELGEPSGKPVSFEAFKELNGSYRDVDYGIIYMYDYADPNADTSSKSYQNYLAAFEELISDMQRANASNIYFSFRDLYEAWRKVYRTSPETGTMTTSNVRWDAINEIRTNSNNVMKYMYYDSQQSRYLPNVTLFDPEEALDYNVYNLIMEVYSFGRDSSLLGSASTSRIVYINSEYERVFSEIAMADATDAMDDYYELLDQMQDYVAEDYTAAAWREVQSLIEEAEAAADEAVTINDWQEALEILQDADSVKGKAVDYSDLQDALMDLYADSNGNTKVSYIQNTYAGVGGNYVYQKEDFVGKRGGYSDEWNDFAVDTDGDSAYTKAATIYKKARASATSVKQSQVDKALEELLEAVDALTATKDVEEWKVVKLQGLVDEGSAFAESDFNTSAKKWETFVNAMDAAKDVVAKANPSASEVERATTNLNNAIESVMMVAKAVPAALKQELKDARKTADKLIANISTQTGAQVAVLREAADNAADVYARFGLTGRDTVVISEVEDAIADLEEAIVNFNNPQGWNKVDGKWYYGAGADNYKGDWYQIGETWFMFNEDGSMKSSEWFQVEGKWYWANENGGLAVGWAKVDGKWYFFDQGNAMKTGWAKVDNNWYYLSTSGAMVTGWNWIGGKCYYFYNNGAMAANTTIGGYTVDANGVWVA